MRTGSKDAGDVGPAAAPAVAAAGPARLDRRRARRAGSGSPPAPSATTWTGCASSATRSRRGRVWPAATGSAPGAPCRPCCSTTRRRWRSRSACAPPRAARSPASRRRRCGRWRSCSRCSRRGCGTGSARSSRTRWRCRRRGPRWIRTCSPRSRSPAGTTSGCGSTTGRHSGATSRRSVEPYRLVNDRRRWYLRRLGRGSGRLADLPGRPDRAADADRAALHAACAAARRGDRRRGGPRSRRGDLAVPGAGDRARVGDVRSGPAADPGGGRAAGRRPVRLRAGLGPSGDARALPGHARRGLRDRRLAGAGRRAAHADQPLSTRDRRQSSQHLANRSAAVRSGELGPAQTSEAAHAVCRAA